MDELSLAGVPFMFRVEKNQVFLRFLLACAGAISVIGGGLGKTQSPTAQEPTAGQDAPAQTANPQDATDPLKRPVDEKKRKQQRKDFSKEIKGPYKKWLDEDVVWLITVEERAAFKQLSNDEERDNFIEAFWQRRDPTPDTEENEYKEEHYRRIAYANEHFAAGIPGWKTDRGRMYIMYGPADEVDSHPSGGS